jgi:hypothetical protein
MGSTEGLGEGMGSTEGLGEGMGSTEGLGEGLGEAFNKLDSSSKYSVECLELSGIKQYLMKIPKSITNTIKAICLLEISIYLDIYNNNIKI